jgi:hypothetical protein
MVSTRRAWRNSAPSRNGLAIKFDCLAARYVGVILGALFFAAAIGFGYTLLWLVHHGG